MIHSFTLMIAIYNLKVWKLAILSRFFLVSDVIFSSDQSINKYKLLESFILASIRACKDFCQWFGQFQIIRNILNPCKIAFFINLLNSDEKFWNYWTHSDHRNKTRTPYKRTYEILQWTLHKILLHKTFSFTKWYLVVMCLVIKPNCSLYECASDCFKNDGNLQLLLIKFFQKMKQST